LWVAVAVPVLVIAWSMMFAARSAVSGPGWALRHLGVVTPVLALGLALGLVAAFLVRPVWLGLSVMYPLAVGAWLADARRRQLRFVSSDGGFDEVDPRLRARLAQGLGRALRIAAAVAWFSGLAVVAVGIPQGWLVTLLGPVAVLIAWRLGQQAGPPASG
jgi:hypothetical protein